MSILVAALYKFTRFEDPAALKPALLRLARDQGVRGTILLAEEGVNGTIAGPAHGIAAVLDHICNLPGCEDLEIKESAAHEQPFLRLKIRIKAEIVTLGQPADPSQRVGTFVAPRDWNAVIDDPDTVVIDTRNAYETGIGGFAGAIDPGTESFRAFPDWWQANAHRFNGKRVAMYCTGGIRCEKASSWLLGEGLPEVLHLRGGILKYLEEVPAEDSRWQGDCFVFDGRVALGHGLAESAHILCHACGRPVSPEGRSHPGFREGVSCAACIHEYNAADRARFAERQRQLELARARGAAHLGPRGPGAEGEEDG